MEDELISEELRKYDEECVGKCSLLERAAMYLMAFSIIGMIIFLAYLIKQVS